MTSGRTANIGYALFSMTPLEELLMRYAFDPSEPDGLLVISHPDAAEAFDLSPLVIASDETGYRVSLALFGGDDELTPSLSVSFDREGRPVKGSDMFAEACAPEDALAQLNDRVARVPLRRGGRGGALVRHLPPNLGRKEETNLDTRSSWRSGRCGSGVVHASPSSAGLLGPPKVGRATSGMALHCVNTVVKEENHD